MHPNKIDSILRKVSAIANKLTEFLPEDYEDKVRTIPELWDKQFLTGDALEAYENIQKDLLLKEGWGEKFSEKSINTILREAIGNTRKHGIEKAKQQFIEECNRIESYSSEMTVYIPLGGIQIDRQVKQPISLGNIELLDVNEQVLGDIIEQGNAITRTMKYSKEEIEKLIEEDEKLLSENFLHRVCAIYRIVAEQEKALEVAERETQRALNLLRYAITDLYNRSQLDIKIDIDSLVPNSYQKTIVLSPSFFGKQWKRSHQPYYISPKVMDVLDALGIFEVSEIMKKPHIELSNFEGALLRGIYWFGKSQTHTDRENEFLNLTTCLEVFFTPPNGDPISNTIAESAALWIGENLEERKRIKKRIKELYGRRSKVSHGSSSSSIEKQDIADLRILTRRVVTTMIKRRSELTTKADIVSWLEEQKLS